METAQRRQIPLLDLRREIAQLREELLVAIERVFEHSQFIRGPEVSVFEVEFGRWLGVEHVVGCASGTDALQLALMALDLPKGSEIITTPYTFVATAEVIVLLGHKPVFVDIDPDTLCISVGAVASAISDRTVAVIPVHLFGHCAHMEELLAVAERHSLYVVEDTAQATGSMYVFSDGRRQKAGTLGTFGCFSFFPSKNLGCYGDGGAVVTREEELAQAVRSIANHGSTPTDRYSYERIGVNSRLDTLQAAILRVKLNRLDEWIARRQRVAELYNEALEGLEEVKTPVCKPYSTHTYHQYVIRVPAERRDELRHYLQAHGIATAVYYPKPLHLFEPYRAFGYREGQFPNAERAARECLALPVDPFLEEDEVLYVAEKVREFFRGKGGL